MKNKKDGEAISSELHTAEAKESQNKAEQEKQVADPASGEAFAKLLKKAKGEYNEAN